MFKNFSQFHSTTKSKHQCTTKKDITTVRLQYILEIYLKRATLKMALQGGKNHTKATICAISDSPLLRFHSNSIQ